MQTPCLPTLPRTLLLLLCCAVSIGAVSIGLPSAVAAEAPKVIIFGYPVTNLDDSGPGSLRQAMLEANAHPGADFITFDSGLEGTIELASLLPTLTESTTISGPGAESVTVDANGLGRVLHLSGASNSAFTIRGLTLTGAFSIAENGAGILLDLKQDLLLEGVHLIGNSTAFGAGGGLWAGSATEVTISESVISNNYAFSGGGVYALYDLRVEHSTIHGNRADLGAGGLSALQLDLFYTTVAGNRAVGNLGLAETGGIEVFDGGQLTMVHTTVVGNKAEDTPGVLLDGSAQAVLVTSSIVADNRLAAGGVLNCGTDLGVVDSDNLSDDASCGFSGASDFQNTDPDLLPLLWAGGPTPTMVPRAGSQLIDYANPMFCDSADQRGFASPLDGDAIPGASCDIGAAEYTPGLDDLLIIHEDDFESGNTSAWSATVP